MNEQDIKICEDMVSAFNKARFDVSSSELVIISRQLSAFAQMIVRHKTPKEQGEKVTPMKDIKK